MRYSYFILVVSLCLLSQNAQAQLVDGMKSLGGFANTSAYISTYKQQTPQQISQSSRNIGFNFSPTYAVYKKKFLLGATIGNGVTSFKSNNNPNTNPLGDNQYFNYNFNLNPFIRYYIKNNNKKAFFGFADAAYYGILSNQKIQVGTQSVNIGNRDYFDWRAGFGGHQVLTKNIVAEAVLYYENNENIVFNANLRHFFMTLDKKNQEAPPQYIAKNRWQIGGSFWANKNYETKEQNLILSLSGGKMVNNHFMVGSGINVQLSKLSYFPGSVFNLSPFVRYYIPITQRLYAYPQIGSNIRLINQKNYSIDFQRNIGFQYFMTHNLVLTCTTYGLFNYSKSTASNTLTSANLYFGFNYFIN